MGILFSKFKPFCTAFGLEWKFLGRRPKPALLFLIAEKEGKKASPLGTYKTYFDTGVLQLPTVKQIKRLYIPFKIGFISRFKRGHLTATAKANDNSKGYHPEPHPAGRRPQDKFIFIRAFYNSLRSDK